MGIPIFQLRAKLALPMSLYLHRLTFSLWARLHSLQKKPTTMTNEEGDVKRYFEIVDYVVFAVMLIVSALIGVYFAFFARVKQNTTQEYLMGGKTMGIFPISMSLIAR